jgi:hypothetical protein
MVAVTVGWMDGWMDAHGDIGGAGAGNGDDGGDSVPLPLLHFFFCFPAGGYS